MGAKKFFYRWIILVASFVLMAVVFSLVNTIHTLFITPVTEEKGFTISSFSLIFTIGAVVVAVMSPIIGKLINIISIRVIMTIGALMVSVGFIGYSFANSIYLFYIIAVIVSIGMAALTTIPISTMITNWFSDARGTALGIVFAGVGTGTFFWMQIISKVMNNYGYHYAYLMIGIIILITAVPISLLLMHLSPEEKYKLAIDRSNNNQEKQINQKADLKKIISNEAFWPFSIGLFVMGIAIAGVQIHVQPYLMSLGYPLAYNANVGSTLAMSALIGSVLGGIIFDKFSTKVALSIFSLFAIVALIALLFAQNPKIPYLFAISFGLCACVSSLWPSYGVGKIFSDENYSATLGIANLFFVIGAALGPFFSGVMADSQFGYGMAWFVYIFLTGIYWALFIRCLKKSK